MRHPGYLGHIGSKKPPGSRGHIGSMRNPGSRGHIGSMRNPGSKLCNFRAPVFYILAIIKNILNKS